MHPFDIEIKKGPPAYRQITDLLREKIQSGKLLSGTRFPPIEVLAKRWKTNYFTVQSALLPLANEGLIESSPRKGTFVRGSKITCTTVGLFFGANFWRSSADGFYSTIFGILCEQLNELGIIPHLLIDSRPLAEHRTPLPALLRAVEKRQIQGIIAPMLKEIDIDWLRKLPVPVALLLGGEYLGDHPVIVANDIAQAMAVSIRRLKEQNCRSVGLISCDPQIGMLFEQAAKKRGVRTEAKWICISEQQDSSEGEGARLFERLWSQHPRPEGLVVFPDVMARGVMITMLERHIRVPQDIKAIFHLNVEMDFYCPLPVEWIVTRATRMATALITSIQRQVAGAPPSKVLVPLDLMSGSELARLHHDKS